MRLKIKKLNQDLIFQRKAKVYFKSIWEHLFRNNLKKVFQSCKKVQVQFFRKKNLYIQDKIRDHLNHKYICSGPFHRGHYLIMTNIISLWQRQKFLFQDGPRWSNLSFQSYIVTNSSLIMHIADHLFHYLFSLAEQSYWPLVIRRLITL